jgi:hypothetical protein
MKLRMKVLDLGQMEFEKWKLMQTPDPDTSNLDDPGGSNGMALVQTGTPAKYSIGGDNINARKRGRSAGDPVSLEHRL